MPLYTHEDITSGKQVEILRPFSEYQDPPTTEEAVEQGLTPEEAGVAIWRKILGTGIRVTRGPNWTGMKGSW